jgi:hypothetical protein
MWFLTCVWGQRERRRGRSAVASRRVTRSGKTKSKSALRGMRHLRKTLDRIARSLNRNTRSVDGKKLVAVYHHGTCTVNHRSRKAASRCRRTY